MSTRYVNIDRDTPMLLPCDLREWVAADDLVHFVLEAVLDVELGGVTGQERGTGSEQYPPRMMLALLIYCYATGVFSSRKIERLTHQDVSVRYLCANTHPDHDTIAVFRARHRELFQRSFSAVVQLARELKLVHLGTVHIDGTKILADAAKRQTLNVAQVEEQLTLADRRVCEALLAQAEEADAADDDRAFHLPREMADAVQRKAKLAAAREALRARAAAASAAQTVNINLTDPDSRLMPQAKGGFIQGYNAQLAVEAHGVIVGQNVCQTTSDITALVDTARTIEAEAGEIDYVVVDQGYDSQAKITETENLLEATVVCEPTPSTRPPAARRTHARAKRAAQRLARARFAHSYPGRELLQQRQTTIEPVFGGLKHNLRFSRFHLRGLDKVRGEWALLTTAYNCRRLWANALRRGSNPR
jgi:transposase